MRLRIGKPKFGQGPASSLIETFSIGAAVDITFTPTGNISANNVQAAIVELDNEKVAKAGDTMTGFLTLSAAPTGSLHAATKQYVDDNVISGGASITYVDDENTAQDVVTATKVSKAGDTMSGLLILSGNPTGNFHAATKEYVDNTASDYADTTTLYVDTENTAQDAVIDTKVSKGGDTLTGFLTLHADPTIDTHAATKKYVDDNIGSGSGTAVATIADDAPSSPVHGQLWFESDTGLMYIWYEDGTSSQWVPITTSAYVPTLIVDTPVLDLTSGTSDLTPDFTLTGDLILDDTVFFEYSTASDFTGAASLTNTIDAGEDAADEISFSTGSLASNTWYFRAKVQRTGYVDSAWSNTETITLSGSSAEVSQFLARTTGLDGTHTAAYTALIDGLVADGIWSKLDALYIFATQNTTNALLNIKSSSYTPTVVGSLTHTADDGYTFTSGSNYIDTNFNASTAGGVFGQNDAHMAVWMYSDNGSMMGAVGTLSGATNQQRIFPYLGGTGYYRLNVVDPDDCNASRTTGAGLSVAVRTSSTALRGYHNGVIATRATSDTATSAAMNNSNFTFPAKANSGEDDTSNIVSGGSFGSQLSDAEQNAFYNRMRTYMTAVGVP